MCYAGKITENGENMETQKKRLDYLLNKLKEDLIEYSSLELPESYDERRRTLQTFMNIRMPRKISEEILLVQDEFLKEEVKEKGIVTLRQIPTIKQQYGSIHPFANRISIWQGDITRLRVGAIVNAANSQMLGCFIPCHKCIDNTIHSAAGMQLREECYEVMKKKRIQYGKNYEEPVGNAIVTKAYNLPAKYIIHTVGPMVDRKLNSELCEDLKNCYENVLRCAMEHNIRSVAFCCISTGEFQFPREVAANIAVETVSSFLEKNKEHFDRIIFNVFKDWDKELYKNRLA